MTSEMKRGTKVILCFGGLVAITDQTFVGTLWHSGSSSFGISRAKINYMPMFSVTSINLIVLREHIGKNQASSCSIDRLKARLRRGIFH